MSNSPVLSEIIDLKAGDKVSISKKEATFKRAMTDYDNRRISLKKNDK